MAKRVPASIRYKNPGAMWGNNAYARKWGAVNTVKLNDGTGQGNTIAVFPDFVKGICAQLDLWRTSKHYKDKKFKDAIAIWSGHNNVQSYIAFVLKRVPGMTPDTVMNDAFWRGPMAIPFLKAQAWHEAGQKYPAPDADWIKARDIVLGVDMAEALATPVRPAVKSKIVNGGVLTWLGGIASAAWASLPTIDNPWSLAFFGGIVIIMSIGLWLILSGRIELRDLVARLKV